MVPIHLAATPPAQLACMAACPHSADARAHRACGGATH